MLFSHKELARCLNLDDMTEIPCLTLHAHWAAAIFQLGKNVENRDWSTRYRGPLAIHAGSKWDPAQCRQLGLDLGLVKTGVILGTVDLVDIVRDSISPWAIKGQYHWILENPKLLSAPIFHRGKIGLHRVRMDSDDRESVADGPRVR